MTHQIMFIPPVIIIVHFIFIWILYCKIHCFNAIKCYTIPSMGYIIHTFGKQLDEWEIGKAKNLPVELYNGKLKMFHALKCVNDVNYFLNYVT